MRRLVLVLSAVCAATLLVSFAAMAEPSDRQYDPSDGSKATADISPDDGSSGDNFVSQGSTGADTPEARAARLDLAEEERLPDYSQVVDNSSKGRFVAPGWSRASGESSHGEDYAFARAGSDAKKATFRFKVPTSSDYAVYAWWTAGKKNASDARFVIPTASGRHTEKVDQTKEGGFWIKLGAFAMKKGERTIQITPSGDADVVADAVAIVRGEQGMLPERSTFSTEDGDMSRMISTRGSATAKDIVRRARKYKGTRYRYSTCTRDRMSCTCETKKSVAPFGHKFPMTERGQWKYEPSRRIKSKRNLKLGDIVFFREGGGRITHVGVFSGRGNIVHASSYFGKVVESKMKYVRGFTGAIRVNPR